MGCNWSCASRTPELIKTVRRLIGNLESSDILIVTPCACYVGTDTYVLLPLAVYKCFPSSHNTEIQAETEHITKFSGLRHAKVKPFWLVAEGLSSSEKTSGNSPFRVVSVVLSSPLGLRS